MESTSKSAIVPSFGDKPRRKRTLDDKACEVCDDKSTGKHYGVYCCDGCSGFFKRTVRRSIPWVCRNNNQCVVDRTSRTDCRACRFQKCLMVKMKPEGVQNPHGSRMSHERTNTDGESDTSYSMNASSDQPGLTVPGDLTDNTSSVSSLSTANRSSPPISMALAGGSSPDIQNRSEPPVLVKVETERCDTYVEVEKNPEIVGSTSGTVGNKSRIVGNNSGSVGHSSEMVGISSEIRNVASSQVVTQPTSTKTGLVTIPQPIRPVMAHTPRGTQELQLVPLVVPNTSFAHCYPYQSTHYPSTSTMTTPRYALTDRENRSPASTEISLRPKSDSLQKMAVQLLSNSVQFAKNIPSFKTLPFRDQIILLEESWKDLFIIDAAFWSFPLDMSYIIPPGEASATLVSSLRVLQELVARIQALELDEIECAYLKTVVLFKPDIKGLKDSQQIEKHQDDAQIKLSDYARTRVENPARFGRLLLTLSAFEQVSQEMVEKLFFRAQNDSVEYILHDLFKKT